MPPRASTSQLRLVSTRLPCTCARRFYSTTSPPALVPTASHLDLQPIPRWSYRSIVPAHTRVKSFSTTASDRFVWNGINYSPDRVDSGTSTSSSKGKAPIKEDKIRDRIAATYVGNQNINRTNKLLPTLSGSLGTGGGITMRCTTLNDRGDLTSASGTYTKAGLCTKYGIAPRDLRKIDSRVPSVVPTILVRRSCILVTLLHLRVVITANEVTLFDPVGSEDRQVSFVACSCCWL